MVFGKEEEDHNFDNISRGKLWAKDLEVAEALNVVAANKCRLMVRIYHTDFSVALLFYWQFSGCICHFPKHLIKIKNVPAVK